MVMDRRKSRSRCRYGTSVSGRSTLGVTARSANRSPSSSGVHDETAGHDDAAPLMSTGLHAARNSRANRSTVRPCTHDRGKGARNDGLVGKSAALMAPSTTTCSKARTTGIEQVVWAWDAAPLPTSIGPRSRRSRAMRASMPGEPPLRWRGLVEQTMKADAPARRADRRCRGLPPALLRGAAPGRGTPLG